MLNLTKSIEDNNKRIKELEQGMTEAQKETILYAVKTLTQSDPETMIGNLEYMIHKLTTHPDDMQETDFEAVQSAQNIICFLNLCKAFKN